MRAEVEIASEDSDPERSERSHGPFTLAGPVDRVGMAALPVRGDLAHIAYAGRYFVPNYAVPQPRAVMPGGTALRAAPAGDSPPICHLMEGDSFEVLEITGEWAWGCMTLSGPTGYVHVDRLEALG